MKLKKLTVALVAGLIGMSSYATFEQFNGGTLNGYMNSFNAIIQTNASGVITNTADAGTGYEGYAYGVPDMQAISASGALTNRQFTLKPNILTYSDAVATANPVEIAKWTYSLDGGVTPGVDGNRWMDANSYYERSGWVTSWMVGNESETTFTFDVDAYTLDGRYQQDVFLKVLNAGGGSGDWGFQIGTNVTITAADIGSTITLTLPIPTNTYIGSAIQAGFQMFGLNANPADDWGSVVVTATDLTLTAPDSIAPDPSPLSFASAPATVSDNKITMTATTATDISGVEYLFTCVNDGSKSSAWQADTIYVADNLAANTLYTFNVQARDLSNAQNAGVASGNASATTLITDSDTPTPNPAEIGSFSASSQSIKLTANPASDASGSAIEYYFDCIAGDGVDSGWQTDNVYVNTALAASSNYTWTVQVRDLSAATNTTVASSPLLVTTADYPGAFALTNTLQSYIDNNNTGTTVHEVLLDELAFADYLPFGRLITFDTAGATFGGEQAGNDGRNIIRTLGNTHANQDFEAYITVDAVSWVATEGLPIDGVGAGIVYLGFGPGDLGAFGVPDWSPNGETTSASFICQIAGDSMGIWSQTNNSTANWDQDAFAALSLDSNLLQRIKLAFDYDLQQATLSIDQSWDGVTFNAEVVVGPVTVPDFSVSPSSVYIGGDDGVILSDFVITGADLPTVGVTDLSIVSSDGSTAVLQWTSESGQTYDVVYKTDLGAGSWTLDAANDDIPGTGGVLSPSTTVAGDDVFYQVIAE